MDWAFRKAGARTRLAVFRNRTPQDIPEAITELASAIREAQILALPGGFSAGDEPDGSGKFIANVFRSLAVADATAALLEERDGMVIGICDGFQALIKLGLVPYGTCRPADETMPTLTFNRLGRHVSRMVRTRVISNLSSWLALEEATALFHAGQVSFCYADEAGEPALAEPDNPNGSDFTSVSLKPECGILTNLRI